MISIVNPFAYESMPCDVAWLTVRRNWWRLSEAARHGVCGWSWPRRCLTSIHPPVIHQSSTPLYINHPPTIEPTKLPTILQPTTDHTKIPLEAERQRKAYDATTDQWRNAPSLNVARAGARHAAAAPRVTRICWLANDIGLKWWMPMMMEDSGWWWLNVNNIDHDYHQCLLVVCDDSRWLVELMNAEW